MASSRFSPRRRPFQAPPTLAPTASDRLAVPKYDVVDPLLGNLSPESTLQALSSTDAVPKNEQAAHDILSKSILQASPTERALGIRAAVAAQKLGQWYREVHAWKWPKRTDTQLGKGFIPPPKAEESAYCGSLPASVVEEHENRIEEIRDGMDNLDVEELKEHVLNAHIPGRSRPSSANSTMSVPPPLSYVQLSDFTAVITATILRTLPLLSRLNALLSSWHVRLLVLRQIPGLLQSLRLTRSELNSALDLLKSSNPPTEKDVLYSLANYHAKRVTLESTVLSAGRRMDRILDSLDGSEDSLPENWIDDLEAIEADFASWVMQAEKRTVENEWRRLSARSDANNKPEPGSPQQEVLENKNLEAASTDTAKLTPVESPSAESLNQVDAVTVPDSVPQAQPAPLQMGWSAPMETIVEEMGSPFDRSPSQSTGIVNNISTVKESAPESPSPLPSDPVSTREIPDLPRAIQLDAGSNAAVPVENTGEAPRGFVESGANPPEIPVDVSTAEEPMHITGYSSYHLPTESNVETPATSNRPESDFEIKEKPPQSPVDALPIKETPPLPQESNDQLSPENMSVEPTLSCEKRPSDIGMESSFQQPDSLPTEEPLHPPGDMGNECLPDSSAETPVGSHDKEISRPTATWLAESLPKKSQSQPRSDTLSADLPSTDSIQAESMTQTAVPSALSPPENPCSQAQGSPSKANTKAELSTSSQAFAGSESLSENNVASSAGSESSKANEEPEPIAMADNETNRSARPQNKIAVSGAALPSNPGEELGPTAKTNETPQFTADEGKPIARDDALVETAPLETCTPKSSERCATPPCNDVASLPNLFMPIENGKGPIEPHSGESEQDGRNTSKKPLESPIKLSTVRPGRLDLDKDKSKSRVRRTSNASDGSLSDYPSLVSSPEIPEPRTSSSNATPQLLETPPHFSRDQKASKPVRQSTDHTLREDRLLHLDAQKPSPRDVFAHNRTLSLPLQRFINESLGVNYDTRSGSDENAFDAEASKPKKAPAERCQKSKSTSSSSDMGRSKGQNIAPTREDSSGPDSDGSSEAQPRTQKEKPYSKDSPNIPTRVETLSSITTERLRKGLTAHPSLESIGPYKSNARPGNSLKTTLGKTKSRSSSLSKPLIRPKDQMDEKINSILTSLPGHIQLVPADQDDDAISVASSLPFRRERFRSDSPQGTPSRSFTPTPSLTLRPAIGRRRHSHAPEESSVKLYHLHRGGKSAPTKLFVRTVGEKGERVMVRVGGGWADLAEYLREYAIHHGRRHVSETPRVEVEGLSSRDSPSYSPPASRMPSGSGRHVPTRPASVLSARPFSSLAVRKTRRSSNVSDVADMRTASAGDALNVSFSPMSTAFPGRRMSVSSNVSAGAMSSVSEVRHGSPGGSAMPLGLAGPKPRAKHATISPESEAWVEDVLGQARRSSSLRPFNYTLPSPENQADGNTPTLPKSRSISDMNKAGSSKRVVLRGLR